MIVLALAVAPIAFGHGVVNFDVDGSHGRDHAHLHGSSSDCDDGDCVKSIASACCGTFGGHCVSGLYSADTAPLNCPDFHSVVRLTTYDQGHRGIDPEAETPPPRV